MTEVHSHYLEIEEVVWQGELSTSETNTLDYKINITNSQGIKRKR